MSALSLPRLSAFIRKETLQVVRDPSSILIAFVLPIILLFLFGYGVSLDANTIRIGVVLEDTSGEALDLAHAFTATRYFDVTTGYDRHKLEEAMVASQLRGVVVIPQDFSEKFHRGVPVAVEVIADGSETNTASFVQNYANNVVRGWLASKKVGSSGAISPDTRVWFNPELKSRYMLLPGALAIIMTLIGILLTALVVAREWERGTMEAMVATPISIGEIILGKITPYFILGLLSMALCVAACVFVFGVPFRGSLILLFLSTAAFLIASLSQGLFISTVSRNQFLAGLVAIIVGFLPAFMLSGFMFEISSMPMFLQVISSLLPPRYFVSILQSSFLSGTVWAIILPNIGFMLLIAGFFIVMTAKKTVKRLE